MSAGLLTNMSFLNEKLPSVTVLAPRPTDTRYTLNQADEVMADSEAPKMPLAASSNMAMSMSTISATSQKFSDMAMDSPTPKQDFLEATSVTSHLAQSKHSRHAATTSSTRASTGGQLMADVQHDRAHSKEKAFNMQRIQLAERLSNESKLYKALEARATLLQDELASLRSSNEALEAECARLHEQIDEATQQLEIQITEAGRRDEAMLERVSDLEAKLDEAANTLEQSFLCREKLQKDHDEAVKACDQQADKVKQLDHELQMGRAKIHDLQAMYDRLHEKHVDDEKHQQEQLETLKRLDAEAKYNKRAMNEALRDLADAKLTISNNEQSHESRESDLQQRLALKGAEAKKLKGEINTLRAACADAISKKEAAQMELRTELAEAQDKSLAESRKLQQSLYELQASINPFPQVIVIGVDVSSSTIPVIHGIKQAYRDVLHMAKSNNSGVKVAVVVHGNYKQHDPSPVQTISDATFRIGDFTEITRGTEDYAYCLEQAHEILSMYVGSKKLIILIGDGNALCSNTTALFAVCEKLRSERVLALSIVIPNHSWFGSTCDSTIRDISQITGGRIEYKDTYLSALDEILRLEREQHFKAS
ncbi:hypothetical protein DL767_000412 [Monosporascus sp. MG133]|nr:hypothetical protein DL767_000412 [Monosporascus sp. MG133]